jgi:hypothetical protein
VNFLDRTVKDKPVAEVAAAPVSAK